jgi:hypothetical protein
MTASSDVELIKRLAHALHGFECATSSGPPDLIPRPSALLAEAYARLAQPEPVASEVRASTVELQVGVEFLDNEGLVVIASYLRRAIALLQRLSTSTNQEESE